MATTSRSRLGRTFLAVAALLTLATALLVLAGRDDHGHVRGPGFWSAFTVHGSEANLPQNIDDISRSADAIVLAHVVDVADGRDIVPTEDQTPRDSAVPAPRSAYVFLGVDEVVAGNVPEPERGRLRLELFAPTQPSGVEELRSELPAGQALFFLWNGGLVAARHGGSETVQQQERTNWLTASSLGVLTAGTYGLEAALHPGERGTPFLRSFGTNDVRVAARRSSEARKH